MAESEEELKSLLMRVKERSEKPGLKLNIQKKLKSWSLVPSSWQIDEEKMKEVTDFISLGSKISVDGDYSQEIKRCLLLERKDMVNLVKVEVAQPVQLFSRVRLFTTPWTAARQASLSITNSRSPPKPMSIESVIAIQTSHPLSSPSPPALNLYQHQGLFKWVSSSHQVAKVLEFQLQHQSFQWTFRTDFL